MDNKTIANYALNDITTTTMVSQVINDSEIDAILKEQTKDKLVTSIADEKKRTYSMVNIDLMNYFRDAYFKVVRVSNNSAWAEREVIVRTLEHEKFKKAFGSDKAYADEIGISTSKFSKIKNSLKVKETVERLTGCTGYTISIIDELISPFNKLKDDFARFINYSSIDLNTTAKGVREAYAHYADVVAGNARPRRKGFFYKTVLENGVEKKIDVETELEYKARMEEESKKKAEETAQAEQETKAEETSQAEQETKAEETAQAEQETKAEETAQAEQETKTEETAQAEQESKTDEKLNAEFEKFTKAVNLCVENSKNMTVTWNSKKRGEKPHTVNIPNDVMKEVFAVLLSHKIIEY